MALQSSASSLFIKEFSLNDCFPPANVLSDLKVIKYFSKYTLIIHINILNL
ncbi:hypothetical protein X975_12105, partial [Stegodyphus mimosarum]